MEKSSTSSTSTKSTPAVAGPKSVTITLHSRDAKMMLLAVLRADGTATTSVTTREGRTRSPSGA